MKSSPQHAGLIAVIGAPNAGKSTLVNQLVGQKVSIVSPKVQTTRFCVRGVVTDATHQVVLVDTPGIFAAKKTFEKSLVKEAWGGVKGVDGIVLLHDARRELSGVTTDLIHKLSDARLLVVLNKVDTVDKRELLEQAKALQALGVQEIRMISAKAGDGVEGVLQWMRAQLPKHPFYFPEDELSDQPMQVLAAEITREKCFLKLAQELPYSVTVVPEAWDEKKDSIHIKQAIVVLREAHKKIIIGKGGDTIKRVGIAARKELEMLTGKRINLTLFAKVDEKWQSRVMQLGGKYEG